MPLLSWSLPRFVGDHSPHCHPDCNGGIASEKITHSVTHSRHIALRCDVYIFSDKDIAI